MQSLYVFWKAHVITSIRIEEKKKHGSLISGQQWKKMYKKAAGRQEMLFQIYIKDRFLNQYWKSSMFMPVNFQGGIHFYIHV